MNHTWGDVSARLRRMGSTCYREVIASAQSGGCDPDMAMAIIDFGEQNGYQLSDIHARLSRARPTLAADFGWREKLPEPAAAEAVNPIDRDALETRRNCIVMQGRKQGVPKEVINRQLASEGLERIA